MTEDKLEAQGMFLEELFSHDPKKKSSQEELGSSDLSKVEPVVSTVQ